MAAFIFFALCAFALVPSQATAQVTNDFVPGEVIVKLKSQPSSSGAQRFMGKATSLKGLQLRRSWSGINMHKFAAKPTASGSPDVQALVRELQADPEVEFAEPNYYVRAQSSGVEREITAQEFQTMAVEGVMSQTNAHIAAEAAWSILTPGQDAIVVAIIDTGLDYNHSVFVNSSAVWQNPLEVAGNGIDDDGNGYVDDVRGWNFVANSASPMDDDGHGTHVAGIVLGVTQNIQANPISQANIKIMPLKFLDGSGVGTTSDAIEAIYYASNNGAKVLNNSWGGGGYSQALVDAINYAYTKKVVFVAAAGNAANNNDANPTYPANYAFPNLISVAATNDWDSLASFSNFGQSSVHMGSPGVSILSTLPNNTYGYANGTSMATPFVSGLAALMLRESPTMNGYQIKQLILSAIDASSALTARVSTSGRLNVLTSVQKAQTTDPDPTMPAYTGSSAGAERAPAAAQMAGGCGLVGRSILELRNGGGSGPSATPMRNLAFFGLLMVLMAPVLISILLRKEGARNNRRYDRFQIASDVRVRVGDRELVGQVSSISLGGVQLNADAWLEHGGIVTMQIVSPDGQDAIKVEGKVVWCEEQKRYGVAFQNAEEGALAAISRWTQGLLKI
ncbi:MAG: S8 family serine peptidase [Bdellovibrionaceae bacterium]|nr:S8 family serine peptidase [Pseudobdellovibrionaceae bacterium]